MRRSRARPDPMAGLQTEGAGSSSSPMVPGSPPPTPDADTMPLYTPKTRKPSPLGFNSPINAVRSPLEQSRTVNSNPFPTPTSKSPNWSASGEFPPAFTASPGYYYRKAAQDISIGRSIMDPLEALTQVALNAFSPSHKLSSSQLSDIVDSGLSRSPDSIESDMSSESSEGLSFEGFASIAAGAKRSPVLPKVDLPAVDDDTSHEAASILMSVAETESQVSERPHRTPRPTGRATSPSLKIARPAGKRAKTATTSASKAVSDSIAVKKPSFNLKGKVEGGIDGVTMAPQKIPYKTMCYLAIEKNGGPTRVSEIFQIWREMWPYYKNMTNPEHIKSLDNSIRHNLSLCKTLIRLEHHKLHPDLVAAEKAKGNKRAGEFWSIIPGRTLANHHEFPPEPRQERTSKDEKK